MDELSRILSYPGVHETPEFGVTTLIPAVLMSFVIGQLLSWTYTRTHSGLSYSRAFAQSLVLMTMIVALVMFVIGNSLVTAFGLIGALALVRFRNVLKDTRDTVFVFTTLVLGMACGSQRYDAAVPGAVIMVAVTTYLNVVDFGNRGRFDGHLTCRFQAPAAVEVLPAVLRRHCLAAKRLSSRHGDGVVEYVYQVRLRDRRRGDDFAVELQSLDDRGRVAFVLHDDLAET